MREVPWHGLGVVVDEYPGREEAMRLAGHNHLIEDAPVFVGEWVDRDSGLAICPTRPYVPNFIARRRADTKELVAILPGSRPIIQNATAWDLVDGIVNRPDVHYETGGILDAVRDADTGEVRVGTIYWVLAWLDEPVRIGRDPSPIYPWLLGTWSHNGHQALRIKEVSIRVVCANTQNAALHGDGRDHVDLRFPHTLNVHDRITETIEQARAGIAHVRHAQSVFVEAAEELARMTVRDEGLRAFIETIVPMPVAREGLVISDRVVSNINEARAQVQATLDGPTCEGIRNTAWGCLQAGSEYFDHIRKARSASTYFKRNLIRESPQKAGLIEVVKEIAAAYA